MITSKYRIIQGDFPKSDMAELVIQPFLNRQSMKYGKNDQNTFYLVSVFPLGIYKLHRFGHELQTGQQKKTNGT